MHRAFTDCVSCALYYSQAVEVNLWVIFTSKASFDDTRPLPPSKMDVKYLEEAVVARVVV